MCNTDYGTYTIPNNMNNYCCEIESPSYTYNHGSWISVSQSPNTNKWEYICKDGYEKNTETDYYAIQDYSNLSETSINLSFKKLVAPCDIIQSLSISPNLNPP